MKRVAIVSPKEIAKDQGKPLSKYERNMMIFDWLHTLGKMKLGGGGVQGQGKGKRLIGIKAVNDYIGLAK